MSIRELASEIAEREGRQHRASIREIRATLTALSDLWFERTDGVGYRVVNLAKGFIEHGKRRAKLLAKKKAYK
jgi:hypothetical protein